MQDVSNLFDRQDNSDDQIRIVMAYQQSGDFGAPYLFRSYDHHCDLSIGSEQSAGSVRNPGPAANVTIWQAARATSAAPL